MHGVYKAKINAAADLIKEVQRKTAGIKIEFIF
jgi:hypothetical protein